MATIESLRQMPALAHFATSELERLLDIAPEKTFEAGWPVYEEGQAGRSCLLITAGEIEVRKNVSGQERQLARLGAGVLVGQGALIDRSHRLVSMHAASEVRALVIDRAVYRRLLDQQDPLAMRLQRQVAIAGIRQLRAVTLAVAEIATRLAAAKDPNIAFADSSASAARTQAALTEWSLDIQQLLGE